MRRFAFMVVAGSLVLGASSAPATPTSRDASERYNYTDGSVTPIPPGSDGHLKITNFLTFRTNKSERSVSVVIADQSGRDVGGEIRQDLDGDRKEDVIVPFCSKTMRPVRITGGTAINVVLREGFCSSSATPLPTSGAVTATFTR